VALLLYQHIQDPAPSLAEARRVLASGGRLVLADVENDLWAVDSDEQSIVRRMLPALADSITNPWIGRRSRALLLEAGFVEVTVELQSIVFTNFADTAPALRSMAGAAVSAGAVTREQADSWLTEQERRDGQGRLFAAIPMFMASARQP
jgi:SAM-dependent methyltransferase